MTENNPKTDATIEQLSDFLMWELYGKYSIGNFENDGSFYDATPTDIEKLIEESLIKFTQEHPVRNNE